MPISYEKRHPLVQLVQHETGKDGVEEGSRFPAGRCDLLFLTSISDIRREREGVSKKGQCGEIVDDCGTGDY